MKITTLSMLALSISLPALAATEAPASTKVKHARKPAVIGKAKEKLTKEEEIHESIAEINSLLRDSRMNPKSENPAVLEDFKEDLQLSSNKATISADDLAKDGGLQGEGALEARPKDGPASAETELE